ncbi:MAG TPA: aminotransferase class IV [Bordetella sp.]|nr:aminotransferase class IV [Bordetella sp.]
MSEATAHPSTLYQGQRPGAAFVDGRIVPMEQARIPILDWGFLHSDATYDVAHVWNGSFFRLEDHLDRFLRGMDRLRMQIPYDRAQIRQILIDCVRMADLRQAYVEMICTRGVAPPGSRDPRMCVNQFYAFAVPFTWIADAAQQERGLRLCISPVHRISPESVDPTVKNYHWLDLVRGLFDAYDGGHETVALTDGHGNVVEGPGFNLFALTGQALATPRRGALEGVTRRSAIDAAASLGLAVEQRDVPADELRRADEVFITSTAGGVMPVGWVDGRIVGQGGAGPFTRRVRDAYWRMHDDPRYNLPVFDAPRGGT